jgi:hypothetical protein
MFNYPPLWCICLLNPLHAVYIYPPLHGFLPPCGVYIYLTLYITFIKPYRKLAYDDFIAVAEDLIARGITSSPKLGIRGGSNGGLLMGNMITRRYTL